MKDVTLAVDTSHDVRVGVARGGQILASAAYDDTRAHVEQLVPLLQQAVTEAGVALDEVGTVVIGMGPGPFTGLRVGIVAGRTLAAVLGAATHGICSLDVMALEHAPAATGEFVVASDARRKELYWARYDAAGVRQGEPQVTAPGELPELPLIGPGAAVYPEVVGGRAVAGPTMINPGLMAARGPEIASAGEAALYLRRPDAAEPTRRKSTLVAPPVRIRRRG